MPALERGDWRIGRVRKDREARGMRQSAWLKRLGRMLRAKGHLVKLPYSPSPNTP